MRYTEAQISSELLDQPEFAGKPQKIFICSTPRSGSYMLCRYMIHAGLGVPHEYFNPVIMREIGTRLGLSIEIQGLTWRRRRLWDHLRFGKASQTAEINFLSKYVDALISRRCQRGVFAAKIHYDQFVRVLDNPVGQQILDGGLFVYLFREDLLNQAISRNFAYVTGRWGIDDTVTTAPVAQSDLLDIDGINREVETLANEDRGWRVFLAKNGLAPISISYEQLCNNPNGFVAEIARRVGIDPYALSQGYSEPVQRQDNAASGLPRKSEVAARYLTAVRNLRPLAKPELGQTFTSVRIPPREAAT